MRLTNKAPSTTKRVLLYGGPKSGKSLLAGKLAEYYNLHWFDAENGYSVLTQLPVTWQERIDIIAVPDSRVMPMAVETWLKVIKGTEHFVCEAHGKCSCALCKKQGLVENRVCFNELGPQDIVVFDSLTQFTNSCISNITKLQADDYKMDFGDWGQLGVLIDKFLSQVQAARYNIVCITHESEVEMEDGRSKLVPVSGSSKSSRNTAKYFDDVIYVEVRNKKHVVGSSTAYSNTAVTGSRSGVELEKAGDKGASLLDIFTSWKDAPKVVTNSPVVQQAVNASQAAPEKAGSFGNMKAAIALNNAMEAALDIEDSVAQKKETPAEETKPIAAVNMLDTSNLTPGQIALMNLKANQQKGK